MGREPRKDGTSARRGREKSEKPVAASADRAGRPTQASRDRQASPAARPSRRDLISAATVGGLILLAVVVVFGQTLRHDFVYDDIQYVSGNQRVMDGLTAKGIAWAFTADYASNWHPITWLSHMLDCQLYDGKPWGHHLSNVLLHAATAILLMLILWRMTGDLWPSAFVAAAFAIHPLRVESVAWVAERKDVLSGLLFMLTLGAYASYVRRSFSPVRYLAVVVLFALGLMAKPMLVTLPLVLLLLDYWPLERMALLPSPLSVWERVKVRAAREKTYPLDSSGRPKPSPPAPLPKGEGSFPVAQRLVIEKLPLLVLSAASCMATTLAQGTAVERLDIIPLGSRIANALVSYVVYLGELFYPVGLAAFYPHPRSNLPLWQTGGAALLLAAICVAVLVEKRRRPYLMVGWFWYVGMLVPVIGLVQVGQQARADRYTYLPHIGLLIAVAWAAKQLLASWPYRAWAWGVGSALAVAALMGCAWQQTSYWRDSEALWSHAVECTANNGIACSNLGDALCEQGRWNEALPHFQEAVKIDPRHVEAHAGLGEALAEQGRFDDAIAEFKTALKLRPSDPAIHNNFGMILAKRGRFDAAIAEYDEALRINPGDVRASNNRVTAINARGRPADDAEAELRQGSLAYSQGNLNEAMAHLRKAMELKPGNAAAHNNLGALLLQSGRIPEAIAQWDEVIRLQPDNAPVLGRVAWLLATSPDAAVRNGPRAVELAQQAAKIDGGRHAIVLDALAAAYAEAGRFREAVETAQQAFAAASTQKNTALAYAIRGRIKLYQTDLPYHEPPPQAVSRGSAP